MCNYSSYVRNHAYKDGMQQGIQDGMQQGIQQGASQKELSNIRSLMETTNWTPKQAMDALKIPPADQAKYAAML